MERYLMDTNVVSDYFSENFISDSEVLNITPDVISHCVNIRRDKKIKLPMPLLLPLPLPVTTR